MMKLKSKMNIGEVWNEGSKGDQGERRRFFEGDRRKERKMGGESGIGTKGRKRLVVR
jgi:hypothetical protein